MKENKSSVSLKNSYREIGEYWDSHDFGDLGDNSKDVEFETDLESDIFYYPVENTLSSEIDLIAKKKGVSSRKLVDLWLREKVGHELAK